jgi:hypothetical protein
MTKRLMPNQPKVTEPQTAVAQRELAEARQAAKLRANEKIVKSFALPKPGPQPPRDSGGRFARGKPW